MLQMTDSVVDVQVFPPSLHLVRLSYLITLYFTASGIPSMACRVSECLDLGQSVVVNVLHPQSLFPLTSSGHRPLRFEQPQTQHCCQDMSKSVIEYSKMSTHHTQTNLYSRIGSNTSTR